MADLGNFNAEEVEPINSFAPLPEGKYRAMIVDSEIKATKKGDGSYLALKFELCGGDNNDGRILYENLNLNNPNTTAVEIAQRTLSSVCRAVGVMKPGNSDALHNIPLDLYVIVSKRKDNGELCNEIKSFHKIGTLKENKANKDKSSWMK